MERSDLYMALEAEGFDVNPTLKGFYEQKYRQGYHRGAGTDMNGAYYGIPGTRNYSCSMESKINIAHSAWKTKNIDGKEKLASVSSNTSDKEHAHQWNEDRQNSVLPSCNFLRNALS